MSQEEIWVRVCTQTIFGVIEKGDPHRLGEPFRYFGAEMLPDTMQWIEQCLPDPGPFHRKHLCADCRGELTFCKYGKQGYYEYCAKCERRVGTVPHPQYSLREIGIDPKTVPDMSKMDNKQRGATIDFDPNWPTFFMPKELQEVRDLPYAEYLKSDYWKQRREMALDRDYYRCTRCPSKGPLVVHHNTYARLGFEYPADLSTLCRRCHEIHHDEN